MSEDYSDLAQAPKEDYSDLAIAPSNWQGFLNNATKGIQSLGHMATVGRDSFMDTATMGGTSALEKAFPLPDNVNTPLGSFDPNMAQPQNAGESVMKGIGSIGGFMAGGPEALMKGVGRGISDVIPGMVGKVAGSIGAGAAGGFSLPGDMNSRLSHAGIGSVLNPAVEGVQAGWKGVSDLMDVNQAKAKLFDATGKASEDIGSNISTNSQSENRQMGQGIQAMDETGITQEHFNDAAQRTADVLDPGRSTHEMPGSPAQTVLSHIKPIEPVDPNIDPASGISLKQPSMSAAQVQEKIRQITSSLETPAKEEFYHQISQVLPDSLRAIKGTRAAEYAAADAAQPLTKIGTLNRIAKGLVTPEKLQEYKQAAGNVGNSGSIEDVMKAGKGLNRARAAQGLAKNVGKLSEFGGIYELLKHLFH